MMKTFALNILTQIRKYSEKLDNIALLTDQQWVVLDELTNSKTVYIFRKNNDLIVTKDGVGSKSKWEYIGNNTIFLEIGNKGYLFRHGFFDSNVLALKLDGKEEYAVLINETRYGKELNTIEQVSNFLQEKYILSEIKEDKQILDDPIDNIIFVRSSFSIRLGKYDIYKIKFKEGYYRYYYKNEKTGKYYAERNNEIIKFSNRDECYQYLKNK